jgi:hypothetical protein
VYLGSLAADRAVFDATANANRGVPRGIGGRSSAGRVRTRRCLCADGRITLPPRVNRLIAIARKRSPIRPRRGERAVGSRRVMGFA